MIKEGKNYILLLSILSLKASYALVENATTAIFIEPLVLNGMFIVLILQEQDKINFSRQVLIWTAGDLPVNIDLSTNNVARSSNLLCRYQRIL